MREVYCEIDCYILFFFSFFCQKVARLVFRNYLKSIGFFSLLSTIIMGILFEGFKTSSNYLFENWSNQIHLNSTMKKNYNLVYAGSFSVVAGL